MEEENMEKLIKNISNKFLKEKNNDVEKQIALPCQTSFFDISGFPKFGKNWLDNFIPDKNLQNIYLTSEVIRNVNIFLIKLRL